MINIAFTSVGQMTAQIKDIKNPVMISIGKPLSITTAIGLIGPKGEKGDAGDLALASINDLGDVHLTNVQEGDILLYQTNKFVNQPKTALVDGGNF
jgi:hypothetical protein